MALDRATPLDAAGALAVVGSFGVEHVAGAALAQVGRRRRRRAAAAAAAPHAALCSRQCRFWQAASQ
jgi:hypothetical protein